MGTISVVPCEEPSREKVTAIDPLVAWAFVSLPGVGQRDYDQGIVPNWKQGGHHRVADKTQNAQ